MASKRTYISEFPDFGDLDVKLPEGFEDDSWHNDVCPSFGLELASGRRLRVFVDYADPDLRECGGFHRFTLVIDKDGEINNICSSDDWADILAKIEETRSAS